MKKVSFKKKFIPLLIIALAVTSIFVYSKSSFAEFIANQGTVSVELSVEKVDKDTVKISLDNFTPVVKSLQLGVKIDGDVKFTEDTIKWLVSSDDENLKNNIKISEDKKVMDIFIVSTEALNKVGGKLEICEIDVNKSAGASSKYSITPNVNKDGVAYSYLLNDTNKQVSGTDIANLDKNNITLNSAPKLELANHQSVIEGKIVISKDDVFNPLDYVIATDDEDGQIDKANITVTKNEVKPNIVGSYNISYSVKDSEGEVATLDTTVIVEEKPTANVQKPVINITNKVINLKFGEVVNLLDGVKAVDYLGREIQVEVSGDYDFNKVGTYTIKYNATDRLGNKADEATATLVVDATKPVITVTNSIISIKNGESVNLLDGVKAVDYLGNEIKVEVSGDYDVNKAGTYIIRYNAVDDLGNKADEVTATLVVDATKPVINVSNKTISIKVGETVDILAGVNAVDHLGNKIEVVATGDYDFNKVGTYTIKYNAADKFGNKADEVTATLIVSATKPVINVTNSIISIKIGESVNLLDGVKAIDYLGKEIKVEVSGDYDVNKVGTYIIRYNATDDLGNKSDEVTATLIVKEQGNPGEPSDPGEPGNPSDPSTPGQPGNTEKPSGGNQGSSNNQNGTTKPSESDNKGKNDLPTTGRGIYFGVTIIIASIIIGTGSVILSKNKKKK